MILEITKLILIMLQELEKILSMVKRKLAISTFNKFSENSRDLKKSIKPLKFKKSTSMIK
jgi:hypothetical protein